LLIIQPVEHRDLGAAARIGADEDVGLAIAVDVAARHEEPPVAGPIQRCVDGVG
jgi:hypothetical protein